MRTTSLVPDMIMHLKKIVLPVAILILAGAVLFACSGQDDDDRQNPAVTVNSEKDPDASEDTPAKADRPVDYKSILGRWNLVYSGNYGYDFRFQKSYKSLVTLYLGNEALVFKGVYSIDGNKIVINIYEMKRAKDIPSAAYSGGFQKANSSSFVFRAALSEKSGKKILKIMPIKIRIDGNNSDGYFEPLIKLSKAG